MQKVNAQKIQALKIKQIILRALRDFFEEENFLEIIIPVANRSIPLEPTIYPFITQWTPGEKKENFYLSASPEKTLKRYLAAGVEKCFGLGHCFRNLEGSGNRHTPEFLMLEWYRTGATYPDIMRDVEKLFLNLKTKVDLFLGKNPSPILDYQNQKIDLGNWQIYSCEKLLREKAGLELAEIIDDEKLFRAAQKKGYQIEGADWEQVFNQIFLNEIENDFNEQPFFLTDFPARISPLCQVNSEKPYLAERFEAYVGGMEIANGNNENLDADMVRDFFAREQKIRQAANELVQPIDEDFLSSLETMAASGHKYAGIGLGFDRLVMLMSDIAEIQIVGFDL